MRAALESWRSDFALAVVREPFALDGLPDGEAVVWRALWAWVNEFLDE